MIDAAEITLWANLIFGDPAETMETALESLEWYAENNRFDLRIAFIGYHPGSKIYEEALAKGLVKDPLAFLLSQQPEINGTTMSDAQYTELQNEIVPHYLNVFGFPGKILDLKHADVEGFYTMRIVCSHCKREQTAENILLSAIMINRMSCKYCNRLQRIPVRMRKKPTDELVQLNDKLNGILQANSNTIPGSMAREVFDLCRSINHMDTGNDLAWWVLISILEHQKRDDDVINTMKLAMCSNPYNLDYFQRLTTLLTKQGRDDEVVKYVRQADILRSTGVTAIIDVEYA